MASIRKIAQVLAAFLHEVRNRLRVVRTTGQRLEAETGGTVSPSGRHVAKHLAKCEAQGVIPLQVEVYDTVGISPGEKWSIAARVDDRCVGIRVGDDQASVTNMAVDQKDDGSVRVSLQGQIRQGETGNLTVCGVLLERLAKEGKYYHSLIDVSENHECGRHVDCIACGKVARLLQIQVTKAESARHVWKKLSKEPREYSYRHVSEVANALRDAIAKKADEIPQSVRPALLLALDSYDYGAAALSDPIASFHARHAAWANGLGFEAIWLIGPTSDLCYRLDQDLMAPGSKATEVRNG